MVRNGEYMNMYRRWHVTDLIDEVFKYVLMLMAVFWTVAPCKLV
jgi:hypothetical protein